MSKLKKIRAPEIRYFKMGQYRMVAFRVTKLNLILGQATKVQIGNKCTAIHTRHLMLQAYFAMGNDLS